MSAAIKRCWRAQTVELISARQFMFARNNHVAMSTRGNATAANHDEGRADRLDDKLIAQLRHPIGYGGVNSEDAYEKFDELRLKAADRIATLTQSIAEAESTIAAHRTAFSDEAELRHHLAVRAEKAEAELAEAEKVIEPFGKMADALDHWLNSNTAPETPNYTATADDLRRAREWRERNHKQEGV